MYPAAVVPVLTTLANEGRRAAPVSWGPLLVNLAAASWQV